MRFKERDHRRAGGGTRDEKLAQKIVEKLSRRAGFVTAALKRWDEEQQVVGDRGRCSGDRGRWDEEQQAISLDVP